MKPQQEINKKELKHSQRWTSTPQHQRGCFCYLDSLLWPWSL